MRFRHKASENFRFATLRYRATEAPQSSACLACMYEDVEPRKSYDKEM